MRRAFLAALGAVFMVAASPVAAQTAHEEPIPDSALEGALQAAVHDPAAQRGFEAAFMTSKVYVRITQESYAALKAAQTPEGVLGAQTPIQIWAIVAEGEAPTIPVFTSEQAYRRAYPDHPWLGMSGRNVLDLVGRPMPVRVGDAQGHSATWSAEDVALLKQRYPAPLPVAPAP